MRLLDFGICRLQDGILGAGVTHAAALLGTPGFLAPEQVASGFGEIGSHTDVFALDASPTRHYLAVPRFRRVILRAPFMKR